MNFNYPQWRRVNDEVHGTHVTPLWRAKVVPELRRASFNALVLHLAGCAAGMAHSDDQQGEGHRTGYPACIEAAVTPRPSSLCVLSPWAVAPTVLWLLPREGGTRQGLVTQSLNSHWTWETCASVSSSFSFPSSFSYVFLSSSFSCVSPDSLRNWSCSLLHLRSNPPATVLAAVS